MRERRHAAHIARLGPLRRRCARDRDRVLFASIRRALVEMTPDTTSFPAVAAMLIQACGTLDCHGTVARNLRLYGDTGLRFSALDVPSTLIATTGDEVTQDYDSVVGLEPENHVRGGRVGGGGPGAAHVRAESTGNGEP